MSWGSLSRGWGFAAYGLACGSLRLLGLGDTLVGDGERSLGWLCISGGCLLIASLNVVMGVSA